MWSLLIFLQCSTCSVETLFYLVYNSMTSGILSTLVGFGMVFRFNSGKKEKQNVLRGLEPGTFGLSPLRKNCTYRNKLINIFKSKAKIKNSICHNSTFLLIALHAWWYKNYVLKSILFLKVFYYNIIMSPNLSYSTAMSFVTSNYRIYATRTEAKKKFKCGFRIIRATIIPGSEFSSVN